MPEEQAPSTFRKTTSNVLKETITGLVEGITGIAATKREDLLLSVGHIFQRLRAGQFLDQLLKEWNQYRGKGKIKEDYQFSEQHKECLGELLDFLDKDIPDETRFEILKQIFLVAATEVISDRNSLLPIQFLKIGKKLTSSNIIVLNTIYRMREETKKIGQRHSKGKSCIIDNLLKAIAQESGLDFPEFVGIQYTELNSLKLVNDVGEGAYTHGEIPMDDEKFVLTGLGFAFCQYIEQYNKERE